MYGRMFGSTSKDKKENTATNESSWVSIQLDILNKLFSDSSKDKKENTTPTTESSWVCLFVLSKYM